MYDTRILSNIWHDANEFLADYKATCDLEIDMSDTSIKKTFWLLYSRYGNSPISNRDIYQFKYKVWTTMYTYGPEWQKKTELQKKLRDLTDSEALEGGKGIMNHANNPSTAPGTESTGELTYVDDQSVSKRKKGKVEAIEDQAILLDSEFNEEYIKRFAKLFSKFVLPNMAEFYIDEEEDGYIGDDVIPPNEKDTTEKPKEK